MTALIIIAGIVWVVYMLTKDASIKPVIEFLIILSVYIAVVLYLQNENVTLKLPFIEPSPGFKSFIEGLSIRYVIFLPLSDIE